MAKKKSQVKESLQITQTPTEGFYSPLDMQFHPAPGKRQEMTVEEMEKLQDKYRGELLGTPVLDEKQVPECAPVKSEPKIRKLPEGMNANNRTNEFLILILESLYRIEEKLNG